MKKPSQFTLSSPEKIVKIQENPQLLFRDICSSPSCSQPKFPHDFYNNRSAKHETYSAFVQEFKDAFLKVDEACIFDPYLGKKDQYEGRAYDEAAIKELLNYQMGSFFPKKVRFLVSGNAVGTIQKYINHVKKNDPRNEINIEVRNMDKKNINVHDRFAIFDDELWHFGGTVGGIMKAVNAYSRGWNSEDHRAKDFFDDIWRVSR